VSAMAYDRQLVGNDSSSCADRTDRSCGMKTLGGRPWPTAAPDTETDNTVKRIIIIIINM